MVAHLQRYRYNEYMASTTPISNPLEWDALWTMFIGAKKTGDRKLEQAVTESIRAWHLRHGMEVPEQFRVPGSIEEALKEVAA